MGISFVDTINPTTLTRVLAILLRAHRHRTQVAESLVALGVGGGTHCLGPALFFVPGFGACSVGGVVWDGDPHGPAAPFPDCPAAAGGPATAHRAPTPLEAAYQVWYWQTKLPKPNVATSPPNGAVTGLDLYLSIGGEQTKVYDVPALGYMVHLEVTSVYDVYWGDPRPDGSTLGAAVTRGHRTQGGPYPGGDLRHQYIERGTATIEVVQRWTAQWSAGGQSGTIADRLATSAAITIPVQEIQAVLRP